MTNLLAIFQQVESMIWSFGCKVLADENVGMRSKGDKCGSFGVVSGLFFVGMFLATGCATICNRHTSATVTLNASPPQTEVIVWKGNQCVQKVRAPAFVRLESSNGFFQRGSYRFEFNKDGYQSVVEERTASISAWYVGNILFGGLIGFLIVDPLSGGMYVIEDESINVNLVPKDSFVLAEESSEMSKTTDAEFDSAYQVLVFNYDEKTRKGSIELRVKGGAFESARRWARSYIASVARDKNLTLRTDLKTNEGRFVLGRESIVDGDRLLIEFETID